MRKPRPNKRALAATIASAGLAVFATTTYLPSIQQEEPIRTIQPVEVMPHPVYGPAYESRYDPGFDGNESPPYGWAPPRYDQPIPDRNTEPREDATRISSASLRVQFNRANNQGWRDIFLSAEKKYKLPKGILFAVASRETSISNICNRAGTDHGVFQINDVAWPEWLIKYGIEPGQEPCKSPPVEDAVFFAAKYLKDARKFGLANGVPAKRGWKFALAAYNAGFYGALWGFQEGHIDRYTAHQDYGKDTIYRMKLFRWILGVWEAKQRSFARPSIELDARHLVSSHGAHNPIRVILHSTESTNQPGTSDLYNIGAWWGRSGNGLGAQIGVDCEGNSALYIDLDQLGWHVAGRNTGAIGIEQVGYASWTRYNWTNCPRMLNEVARWIAYISRTYDVPIRRNPYIGVSTHNDQSQLDGGGHWDPGPNYPFDLVLQKARTYKKKGWRH